MYRKFSNLAVRLLTSPVLTFFRTQQSSARMFSFNSSVRKCCIHNNKRHIISGNTSCFVSLHHNHHLFPTNSNRHMSVLMSTRTGLLVVQKRPIIETLNDWQTQLNYLCKISKQSRLLYAFDAVRDFSSKSKVHEESKFDKVRAEQAAAVLEDIHNKIIFMNDSIVAVNKPYGISVFGSSVNSNGPATTLVEALPKLKDKLKCQELDIGLSLKSFYSGIVLLCKHNKSKKQVENVVAGAYTQKTQFLTYLAITVGVPQCSHGVDMTANIHREYLHNREMSTVSDKYVHMAAKDGTMIKTCFNVQPLVVNSSVGAALVQVTINKDKWEAVEVLLSHYLSPVLGDHIYSSRTQMVSEVPLVASAHASLPGTQRLPPSIVKALQPKVNDGVDKDLPFFVHRHKVVLNKFPTRSSRPLIITAPPPEQFLTTLQCLGLYQEGMFS